MGIDSQVQAGRILTGTESISLKVKASNARHIYGKVNGLRCRRISIQQGGGGGTSGCAIFMDWVPKPWI